MQQMSLQHKLLCHADQFANRTWTMMPDQICVMQSEKSFYLLNIEAGIPVTIAGGFIAPIGVGILARFVLTVPLPVE